MEIKLQIPDYQKEKGLEYSWENNFTIEIKMSKNAFIIKANKEGLISLSKQLLTLAQNEIPNGTHLHFDEYNSLEEGSTELIIEKI